MLITDLLTIPLSSLILASSPINCANMPAPVFHFRPAVSKTQIIPMRGQSQQQGFLSLDIPPRQLQYDIKPKFRTIEKDGQVCVALDKVLITFKAAPTIAIDSAYPKGSCPYSAILRHQNKLTGALKSSHRDLIPRFQQQAQTYVAQVLPRGPVDPSQLQRTKRDMITDLRQKLNGTIKEMSPIVAHAQNRLNSPAAQEKVLAQCDDWARFNDRIVLDR